MLSDSKDYERLLLELLDHHGREGPFPDVLKLRPVGPDNHYGRAAEPYEAGIGCPRPASLSRGDVEAIVAEQLHSVGERVADAVSQVLRG